MKGNFFTSSFPSTMENTKLQQKKEPDPQRPQNLSGCSSGRRSSADSNSPEFEFWMVRNPSFPAPNLLSADELFSHGVLLPLHRLQHHTEDDPPDLNPPPPSSDPPPQHQSREPCSNHLAELPTVLNNLSAITFSSSKRWRDIFKKSDKKNSQTNSGNNDEQGKEKKKEKKGGGGGGNGASSAELNIYLWPFSRSRSAGTGCTRPRMGAGSAATRKVSSAPCSRSNSAGESKSRKWPSSPSRGGVQLGRSSPVWQVRRGGSNGRIFEPVVRTSGKGSKKEGKETRWRKTTSVATSGGGGRGGGAKAKVLNLNVPPFISYRSHLSCRSDENSAIGVAKGAVAAAEGDGCGSGSSGRGSNLLNLRSLFAKKVY